MMMDKEVNHMCGGWPGRKLILNVKCGWPDCILIL